MKAKRSKNYLVDPTIVPRLQEFLEISDLPVVNIEDAAEYLQDHFWEYKRKKRAVFTAAVEKAYQIILSSKKHKNGDGKLPTLNTGTKKKASVCKSVGSSKQSSKQASCDESFSSDNEGYLSFKDANMANSSLSSLYAAASNTTRRRSLRRSLDSCEDTKLSGFGSQSANFAVDRARAPIREVEIVDIITTGGESSSLKRSPEVSGLQTEQINKRARFEQQRLQSSVDNAAKTSFSTALFNKPKDSSSGAKTARSRGAGDRTTTGAGAAGLSQFDFETSGVTFAAIGGCDEALTDICKLLMHLKHPEIFRRLGIVPPRGFLLHGPPGCGKTLLAHAIAGEFQLPLLSLAAPEIVSGVSGESEQKLRELFAKASSAGPCIVFIDEIDAITPKRESVQREMERRIVAQLLSCLDEMSRNPECQALFIGATNRPESLDPALRRAGRFDKEIALGIPDEKARAKILEVISKGLALEPQFDFLSLARKTPGFVGADLSSLAQEACVSAVERIMQQLERDKSAMVATTVNSAAVDQSEVSDSEVSQTTHSEKLTLLLAWLKNDAPLSIDKLDNLNVLMADFERALKSVHPSAKREGFATVPDVSWTDIGALGSLREELHWSILYPIQQPERFEAFGLNAKPQGILMFGPPGCGKTLLAKAVAKETGMNFISVKGPELLSMYVGESERAVRQVFQRARNSAPCVIFFDELDALCPRRTEHDHGGSVRVVNQLLTEMDGIEDRKQVFLIGATNRPDIIDPAILRPGRLDKTIYVGFPVAEDRADILRALTKGGTKPPLDADVNLVDLSGNARLEGFSGADLAALVREASVVALKESLGVASAGVSSPVSCVKLQHFLTALQTVSPSVSGKERESYEQLRLKFTRLP